MKNDQIQPLNYCAHAIEDLQATATKMQTWAPMSAVVYRRLIDMLRSSVKFILPNCCNLVDPDDMRQSHLDLMRLPFPCVAFEAPWVKEEDGPEYIGEFHQGKDTKRIALCWEARPEYEVVPGLNLFLDAHPEGGICVVPIYWGPEGKLWTVAMGGVFIPYENKVGKGDLEQAPHATRIAYEAQIEAGKVKANALKFSGEPFCLLPEFFEQAIANYGSHETALAQILHDAHDEAMVLIETCSVINCANVATANVDASAALNKKRQASGKQPFFSYKVLQLTEDRRPSDGNGAGGHHASPRMHLRRGHLRRLESKTIWVRPVMVKADSMRGVVLKDYAVPPPKV